MPIISILNRKGGSGKTTATVECAYQAGKQGKTVLVVDLDSQCDATAMLLGLPRGEHVEPNIFDLYLAKDPAPLLGAVAREATEHWPNVFVIPGSSNMSTIDGHISTRAGKERILSRILAPLRGRFDLILIDNAPAADHLTLASLIASDRYHVPIDLSDYGIGGLKAIQDLAQDVVESGSNPGLKFAGYHLSAFQKGGSYGVRGLEEDLRPWGTPIRVNNSTKCIESQRRRVPVGELDPEGNVARAFAELTDRFMEAL